MLKFLLFIFPSVAFFSMKGQTFKGVGNALADKAVTCFSIPVSGVGIINGVYGLSQVCINIDHPVTTELEIILTAPDGVSVPLSIQNGGSGTNYTATCFNASSILSIARGKSPFSGLYNPQGYLGSVNNGQNADGIWKLCVKDIKTGNVGNLTDWSIGFSNTPAPPLPLCFNSQPAGITCQDAPRICNFNGFCGNTFTTNYGSNSWAELNAIFCATINNNSFISFIASASTESFKVYVTKSQLGNGIQLLFFSGPCGKGTLQSHGCYNQLLPGSGYTMVTATGLLPGSSYYLMVDGYSGDECEYTLVADSVINFINVTPATASMCKGDSVSLTAIGGNGTYSWSPSIGLSNTSGSIVRASPDASITYIVSSNANNNCSLTAPVTINVNSAIKLGNDTSISICSGKSLDLTTVYATAGSNTHWSLNGNAVTNPSAIYFAGQYQLITNNLSVCGGDTALVTVKINPSPNLGADKTVSSSANNAVDLAAQFITTGLLTNWTIRGLTVIDPTAVTLTGLYRLVAIGAAGCTDTAFVTIAISPKPKLGPDKLVNTCTGTFIDLTALYNTSGLIANWSVGGSPVNDPSAVSMAGIYQLIVTNPSGYSDSALVTLVKSNRIDIGSDSTIAVCQGISVDLTKEVNTAGLTNTWTIAGINVADPSMVTTAGLYKLVAANGALCSDTTIFTVIIHPKPNLGVDQTVSLCAGTAIHLTDHFSTTNLISNWTSGGIEIDTLSFPTTLADYQLTAFDANGCADTALLHLVVKPKPLIIINDPAPECMPASVNLTVPAITSGSAAGLFFSYWKNPAANIPFLTPDFASDGIYYLKGTDINGCFDVKPATVIVYSYPTVNAGNDTTICYNSPVLLKSSVVNTFSPASYLWNSLDALVADSRPNLLVSPLKTTMYSLTVTVDNGICKFTKMDSVIITVEKPVAAFAGNDTSAMIGVAIALHGSGGVRYNWSPAAILDKPNTASPTAVLLADTRFMLKVTDVAGCSGYDTILVKALKGPAYYLPNAFTPNGDGVNDLFRPVPIGIRFTQWFRIFNRQGQKIFESTGLMEGWDGMFKGIIQPSGNYVWMIKGEAMNGNTIERKGNVLLIK